MQNIVDNRLLGAAKILGDTVKVPLDSKQSLISQGLNLNPQSAKGSPDGYVKIGNSSFYETIYGEKLSLDTTNGLPVIGAKFNDGEARKGRKVMGTTWVNVFQDRRILESEFMQLATSANDRATLEREFVASKIFKQDTELLRALVTDYSELLTLPNGNTEPSGKKMKINTTIPHNGAGLTLDKLREVRKYYASNKVNVPASEMIIGFVTWDQFFNHLLEDVKFANMFKVQLSAQQYGKIDLGYDITASYFDVTTFGIRLVVLPHDIMFNDVGLVNLTDGTVKIPFTTKNALTLYKSKIADASWDFPSNSLIQVNHGSDFSLVTRFTGIAGGYQHNLVDLHFRCFGAAVRSANREVILVECSQEKINVGPLVTQSDSIS